MSYLRIIRWTAVVIGVVAIAAALLLKGNGEPTPLAWAILALAFIGVSIADLIDGSWRWHNSLQLEDSSARIAATITLLISLVVLVGAILNM
jgi:uncharacterized membrane protein YidH (DUF202 family)